MGRYNPYPSRSADYLVKRKEKSSLVFGTCPLPPLKSWRRKLGAVQKVPDRWTVNYGDLVFNIKPMGFKHTGVFPEQAVNWDLPQKKLKTKTDRLKFSTFSVTQAVQLLRV